MLQRQNYNNYYDKSHGGEKKRKEKKKHSTPTTPRTPHSPSLGWVDRSIDHRSIFTQHQLLVCLPACLSVEFVAARSLVRSFVRPHTHSYIYTYIALRSIAPSSFHRLDRLDLRSFRRRFFHLCLFILVFCVTHANRHHRYHYRQHHHYQTPS